MYITLPSTSSFMKTNYPFGTTLKKSAVQNRSIHNLCCFWSNLLIVFTHFFFGLIVLFAKKTSLLPGLEVGCSPEGQRKQNVRMLKTLPPAKEQVHNETTRLQCLVLWHMFLCTKWEENGKSCWFLGLQNHRPVVIFAFGVCFLIVLTQTLHTRQTQRKRLPIFPVFNMFAFCLFVDSKRVV